MRNLARTIRFAPNRLPPLTAILWFIEETLSKNFLLPPSAFSSSSWRYWSPRRQISLFRLCLPTGVSPSMPCWHWSDFLGHRYGAAFAGATPHLSARWTVLTCYWRDSEMFVRYPADWHWNKWIRPWCSLPPLLAAFGCCHAASLHDTAVGRATQPRIRWNPEAEAGIAPGGAGYSITAWASNGRFICRKPSIPNWHHENLFSREQDKNGGDKYHLRQRAQLRWTTTNARSNCATVIAASGTPGRADYNQVSSQNSTWLSAPRPNSSTLFPTAVPSWLPDWQQQPATSGGIDVAKSADRQRPPTPPACRAAFLSTAQRTYSTISWLPSVCFNLPNGLTFGAVEDGKIHLARTAAYVTSCFVRCHRTRISARPQHAQPAPSGRRLAKSDIERRKWILISTLHHPSTGGLWRFTRSCLLLFVQLFEILYEIRRTSAKAVTDVGNAFLQCLKMPACAYELMPSPSLSADWSLSIS